MGGPRLTPSDFAQRPSVEVIDFGYVPLSSHQIVLVLLSPLDLAEYTEVSGGIEVYVDGTGWVICRTVYYDPDDPLYIVADWSVIYPQPGQVWRLRPPVSSWTSSGNELLPDLGVLRTEPEGEGARPVRLTQNGS